MKISSSKINRYLNHIVAFIVCIYPIVAPYKVIGPFSIDTVLLMIVSTLLIFKRQKILINTTFISIFIMHMILSFIAYFTVPYNKGVMSMFYSIGINLITIFCISQVFYSIKREIWYKYTVIISIVCGAFLIYQIIMMNMKIIPHDGQLFENLVSGYSWSNAVTYMRPNSLFMEPSYFAIFMLPIFELMLIEKKYKSASLYAFLMFISTSSLGILGTIIIIFIHTLVKKDYKIVLISLITLMVGFILLNYLDMQWIIVNNLEKIHNMNSESKIRIIGYLSYFEKLPYINQFIGVGFGQMGNYFSGYRIENYSNAFVLILMNFGIIGAILYIGLYIYIYIKSSDEGKIFVLILLMISCIDGTIYNSNYYYLMFYILMYFNKSKYLSIKI